MRAGKTPKTKDYFNTLETPNTNDMELQLQQLVQQGVITPEDAQAALVGDSAMSGITLDPKLKENQMAALSQLSGIVEGGGLSDPDRAALMKLNNEEDTHARGAREAILQNAQARGVGGSGLEIMAELQNAQDAAGRASMRGTDVAADARNRALQAIMEQGNLSGQIANQEFGQKAQVAGAQDAIAKFNAQNQQGINLANTQAHNSAQEANLASKQNISNQNVGLNNQQQEYNKNLIQQNYENELKKRSGQAGIAQGNAAAAGQNSQNQANANNQMISTVIGAGATLGARRETGGMILGEPTEHDSVLTPTKPGEFVIKKEDVPEMLTKMHTDEDGNFNAAGFLDQITGGCYGYSKGKKS